MRFGVNKICISILGFCFVLLSVIFGAIKFKENRFLVGQSIVRQKYIVTKVIDGDTFEINNSKVVRLFGIDCPEVYKTYKDEKLAEYENYFGQKATNYVKKYLAKHNFGVYLDVISKDKYNRDVCVAYVNKEAKIARSLNLELIKNGLAIPAYLDVHKKKSPYYQKGSFALEYYKLSLESYENAKMTKIGLNSYKLTQVFHKKRRN